MMRGAQQDGREILRAMAYLSSVKKLKPLSSLVFDSLEVDDGFPVSKSLPSTLFVICVSFAADSDLGSTIYGLSSSPS